MSSQKKLHEALVQKGLYTKSFEDFQVQFAPEDKQALLHKALIDKGLYSKDAGSFTQQFFAPKQQSVSDFFQSQSSQPEPEPASGPSLADAFSSPLQNEPEEIEELNPEEIDPMLAQFVGKSSSSSGKDDQTPDDLDSIMASLMKPRRKNSIGDSEKQTNVARSYISPDSENTIGSTSLGKEGERFKTILGNLLGDEFDPNDGVGSVITQSPMSPADAGMVRLASGKKKNRMYLKQPMMGVGGGVVNNKENEMIDIHLSELPSILSGEDERFTPRQVGLLTGRIGPLINEVMMRGNIDNDLNIGTTRMFSPQQAGGANEPQENQELMRAEVEKSMKDKFVDFLF